MSEKWSFKIPFPVESNYVNRITEVSFGPSKSSGNPMITMTCEVVMPQEIEAGGEMYNIAGVKTTNYYTTKTLTQGGFDEEKTENQVKRIKDLLTMLFPENPEYADKFNPDNPDADVLKAMQGKLILTQMSAEVTERRKTPTAAQIEEAKKTGKRPEGDVMKHPITGKPLISYRPKIDEIFGLAPEDIASANSY